MKRLLVVLVVAIPVLLALDVWTHQDDDAQLGLIPGTTCAAVPLVVLEAQAVPSAGEVPCITVGLDGWQPTATVVENGSAALSYSTGEVNGATWDLLLTPTCQTPADATPTSWSGREVRETRSTADARATRTRWITVPGACVQSTVSIPAQYDQGRILDNVDRALQLPTRAQVATIVENDTDGVMTLDPPPAG